MNGELVALPRESAERLRNAAARRAAESSTLRDLSLVLNRAIQSERVVALQRHEMKALTRLLAVLENEQELAELRGALDRAAGAYGS